jgi:tRNA pseudouridine13 synthase
VDPRKVAKKSFPENTAFAILDRVKLKRLPEDFQVEELTEFRPADIGEFALYRLTKRGLGTLDAMDAVVQRWKLSRAQLAYGGLKDRHAESTQYVTIHRGPRRNLRQTNLELRYLGQAARPFTTDEVAANRFRIVLRSLSDDDVAAAQKALHELGRDGLPNYFDDQRFGSLGESHEFVARAWIAGDYERALWLAIADANPLDRPGDRAQKRLLREHWGDWPTCKAGLAESRQNIVSFLCGRPRDFRGALARVPHQLRSLYIAAFQSYLWNRLLAAQIVQICPARELVPVPLKMGTVPFYTALADSLRGELRATRLPLPSSRIRLEVGPINDLVTQSLAELGLALREIRIKYPRDSFFSKGWRPAVFNVDNVSHEVADDELYAGQRKLILRFDLPRGAYATILVKRITLVAGLSTDENIDSAPGEFREEESQTTA